MRIYRFIKPIYAGKLEASGNQARWNYKGHHMVYASESSLTAFVEVVMHSSVTFVEKFKGCDIWEVPDDVAIDIFDVSTLSDQWSQYPYPDETLRAGSDWLTNMASVVMRVPAAIIQPEATNVLINPKHPDILKIIHVGFQFPIKLDSRFTDILK